MTWRTEISYDQLPQPLRMSFAESSLLWACANPDAGTIVVWAGTDRRRELEFSLAEARLLTRDERERALPPKREFPLPDQRCRVVHDARLLPDSDIRYERYAAYDARRAHVIAECGQNFFGPVYQDPEVMVVDAVRAARFPGAVPRGVVAVGTGQPLGVVVASGSALGRRGRP
jgi:hypothetical protein